MKKLTPTNNKITVTGRDYARKNSLDLTVNKTYRILILLLKFVPIRLHRITFQVTCEVLNPEVYKSDDVNIPRWRRNSVFRSECKL